MLVLIQTQSNLWFGKEGFYIGTVGIGTGNFLASIVDNDKFKFSYILNENESYFTLSVNDYYFYSGIGMNTSGQIDMFIVGLDGSSALWSQSSCDDEEE